MKTYVKPSLSFCHESLKMFFHLPNVFCQLVMRSLCRSKAIVMSGNIQKEHLGYKII